LEAPDEFEADKVQHRVHLKRDLNVGGAVFVTTPDQQQIYATPIAIGLYSPKMGSSHSWRNHELHRNARVQQTLWSMKAHLLMRMEIGFVAPLAFTIGQANFEQDYIWQGRLSLADIQASRVYEQFVW